MDSLQIKRGQIRYVDLGDNEGSEQSGFRPAIIIQNDVGNMKSRTTIVAPITSKWKYTYPFHVFLSKRKYNLKTNCVVLLEQIRVVDKNKVHDYIDTIDDDMVYIDRALKLSVGI